MKTPAPVICGACRMRCAARLLLCVLLVGSVFVLLPSAARANPPAPAQSSSSASYQFGQAEGRTVVTTRRTPTPTPSAQKPPEILPSTALSSTTSSASVSGAQQPTDPSAGSAETANEELPSLPPPPELLLSPLPPEETISFDELEGPLPTSDNEWNTDSAANTATAAETESQSVTEESLIVTGSPAQQRNLAARPVLEPPPLTNLLFYLVLLLVLAGAIYYFITRGWAGTGFGKNASRRLQIAEIRSLGNRQFLVVAEYDTTRVLLGVSPGRVDFLRDLPAPTSTTAAAPPAAPDDPPIFQPPPNTP